MAPLMEHATRGGTRAAALDRRFEAVVFDWDGTAVPDRSADASSIKSVIEDLSERGMHVAIVSGTHVENIDGQLRARVGGPGRLWLCVNRGSEVYEVGRAGPALVHRRTATPEEDRALDLAAVTAVERLSERGVRAEVVSHRLNRRKIDLIPTPEWADPPKAEIDRLVAAVTELLTEAGVGGLPEATEIARGAALAAGLTDACITSDAKHIEIGLTDKADSARWIVAALDRLGVGAGLTLIAGDEMGPLGGVPGSDSLMLVPEASRATAISVGVEPSGVPPEVFLVGGGPAAFLEVLRDQLQRREEGEPPCLDERPGWVLSIHGYEPERERVREALLTLADGTIGTAGVPLFADAGAEPVVRAAGSYEDEGAGTHLAELPAWNVLPRPLPAGASIARSVDLRAASVYQEISEGSRAAAVTFSSLATPGLAVLRARSDGADFGSEETGTEAVIPVGSGGAAIASRMRRDGATIDRFTTYHVAPGELPDEDSARLAARAASDAGFDRLFAAHREAWADRWRDADISIDGDEEVQLAVRFSLFHLIASVGDGPEAAVGARGLSGPGYRGHVFWDADVFVLPFLAATHPASARAMLEYRIRRLPAARAAAAALGRAGARFPWESARDGRDVTPHSGKDQSGRVVPIRTGQLEEHIVADVAWGASTYVDWTGDLAFEAGPGRELFVETARYWASRIRLGSDGRAHIYGVTGPDEYHEPVDDNAFTNVMARWNLRRAADAVRDHPSDDLAADEVDDWLALADGLVDNYDPTSGVYEQFAGFRRLEPLIVADVAPRRPIAADLLLGRDRVRGAQVLKQADVLMLHHMIPEEVSSLEANLDFYEPRTAHGSSLSPGVHASLFARAGYLEAAWKALRIAARMDIDDVTGTSGSGVHLATMGTVWQALAMGFAGLRPRGDSLEIDPRVPASLHGYDVGVRFRGRRVRVHAGHEGATVWSDRPLAIRAGSSTATAGMEAMEFIRTGTGWQVKS